MALDNTRARFYTSFMDSTHIYQKIVDSIRQDIISGELKPGTRLPAIRKMTEQWHCNTGTILRAYQELSRLGLIVSHVGQGTKVVDRLADQNQTPMRRATLYNRSESFLLEIMNAGYTPSEVEESLRVALDRWRTVSLEPIGGSPQVLRFVGSHDPAMALIAAKYREISKVFSLQLSFTGSLGGLIALAEKKADLAGCHLWDEITDTYNEPFVRKLLPGQKIGLVTLAHRRVGLILAPRNPLNLKGLTDLTRTDIRYVNRQQGSGTRVWFDAQLQREGIKPEKIPGYAIEKMTHSEVAKEVSEGRADVGLGIESAARSFGLEFFQLTTERYDLVIPQEKWELETIKKLMNWLNSPQAKIAISNLGGYDTTHTGQVSWVY